MTERFTNAIAAFAPRLPLAVALSGGADSTALLLACVQRWPQQVRAIHVNHGLQAAAADFERHCVDLCARWRVPLLVQQVDARHAPGQSPEDAARQARYKAFKDATRMDTAQAAIQSIALAQHADDQVETLLLALSRGAGLAGLSAMPSHWQRSGLDWHRPLLQVSGPQVRQWLQAQGESWVEDPSNHDLRYTRNRIRAHLLPVLQEVFPQFRDTFARSSAHAAQAQELLQECAQHDFLQMGTPPHIAALRTLTPARQAQVLRYWLRTGHATTPTAAQLAQLQQQLYACSTRGHHIHLRIGRGSVRREDDVLVFTAL